MIRPYLKLHLWLKAKCDRLTLRQRRIFLYSVSAVYFFCSVSLIILAFIPKEPDETGRNEETKIIDRVDGIEREAPKLYDAPLDFDSLYQKELTHQPIT